MDDMTYHRCIKLLTAIRDEFKKTLDAVDRKEQSEKRAA